MPKVKKSTKKDPPEKVLADLAKKYPQLLSLNLEGVREQPTISQGKDRSYPEAAVDLLRALSQPRNYAREIKEGEFLPTQLELDRGKETNPIDDVVALANPFDHVYATLAMAGVVDDPNYDNEYSTAALLGLVTGSAGQKVPKALEKTVGFLRDEGVKSYSDISRALKSGKANDIVKELSVLKDKAVEFSRHTLPITQKAYKDVISSVPGRTTSGAGNIKTAATNFMIESDPDALLKFTPESFEAGAFDESMRRFADEYLTSFRSVRASNPEDAIKYITNPIGTGRGGRNLGAGLYQGTKASQLKTPDAGRRPGYGDHLGAIRIAPQIGGSRSSASQIIKDIQEQELLGSPHHLGIDERNFLHDNSMFPGFQTSPEIRVSRSGTGVNLLDQANTPEGRKALFDKYDSDYYGASFNTNKPRGLELLPKFGIGGKMKPIKKAQEGMKLKKSNGDPPKGYKRDADGYLTPVDFNEFHEMPSDSLNVDAIKKGISMAESIGGVLMMNPTSTATGMYGQRYSEIKDLPFMKGISREEFSKDLPLQEKVFEMRMDEGIGGPSIRRNVMELTEEYAPQLGDDWNFSPDDVAFLSNFIGRQGTRKYFASLRDGTKFSVPGTNKTVDEYLKIARGAAYKD